MTMQNSLAVLWKRFVAMLLSMSLLSTTKSWSEESLPVSGLSSQETSNLAKYIRTCEVDRQVLKATDQQLTACEFDRKCPIKWQPFFIGVLAGAAAIYIYENERHR